MSNMTGIRYRRGEPLTSMMDNVLAWRIGEAAIAAAKAPGGDYIDTGLILLRLLNEKGLDVLVRETPEPPA